MNLDKYYEQRKLVADTMTRLYNTRLTTTSGGNISCRINKDLFCITPSSLDKGTLTPDLIAVVTMDGENLTPNLRLSIEGDMHRLILAENPELSAVAAMKKSRLMMKGNKWALFCLSLSFFGWIILAGALPGGYLLLAPYMEAADAAFYLDRTGRLEGGARDLGEMEAKA